jgi:hypothetical protein
MKECSIVLLMRTCRNLKKTNVSQKKSTYPGGRGAWVTGFNGLGPEPPDIVRGIINPDVAPSDIFVVVLVGGREPVLDPSLSEVADGEPLTDAIKDVQSIKKRIFYFLKSKIRIEFYWKNKKVIKKLKMQVKIKAR